MEHLSCSGCRYARKGRCANWTVQSVLGGEQVKGDGNRICYEAPQTLTEGLALYLQDQEASEQSKR